MNPDRRILRGCSLVLAAALLSAAARPSPAPAVTLRKNELRAQKVCQIFAGCTGAAFACGPPDAGLELSRAGRSLKDRIFRLVSAVPAGRTTAFGPDPARALSAGLSPMRTGDTEPRTVLEVVPEPSAGHMLSSGCPRDLAFTFLYCAPDECTLFVSWPAYCAWALPSPSPRQPGAVSVLLELAAFDGTLEAKRYVSPLLARAAGDHRGPRRLGRREEGAGPGRLDQVGRAPAARRISARTARIATRAGAQALAGLGRLGDRPSWPARAFVRGAPRPSARQAVPVAPPEPW